MQSFNLGVSPFFKFLTQTGIPILPPVQKTINHNGVCAHMSVCMSGFRDNDLEEFIQQNGGNIVSGVSKKTTHLVVKDKSATSSKISKAQSLGIPILSIEEFSKFIGF